MRTKVFWSFKSKLLEASTMQQSYKLKASPLSEKYLLELKFPGNGDNIADADRLRQALETQIGCPVSIPLELLREIPAKLRQNDWKVTVTIGYYWPPGWGLERLAAELVELGPGSDRLGPFGLAVDLGSTTVGGYLWDLGSGKLLAADGVTNAQTRLGEDILTRIHYAATPQGLAELQQLASMSINRIIDLVTKQANIVPHDITAGVISGNTTMVHLLLGLPTANICRNPYVPVVNAPGFFPAAMIGLDLHPRALVYLLPSVGSYVGGDILAGILASGMHRQKEISLLADIGTNGEIVLGNREWLVVAAGAAGPALEGGVVACGMRAEPGAVCQVRIDADTGKVTYRTIGDVPARGICGSGLVDAIAQALLAGIINQRGELREPLTSLVVVPAEESATGQPIELTPVDIQRLLRTKAAVNAIIATLLESVGCTFADLKYFYAAGAFGDHLDIESAITLGLYPDLPRENIIRLGNSSGTGASLVLTDINKAQELEEIARRVTYLEMNNSLQFMAHFTAGLFFPHTDLDLFPTVKARLKH
ncbi:ASKHA domain-containing protein [Moorella sulfitireducens]|uniref:ASKHA domain-containing protein n=1 Tax=Neomoorella sulfitireducens TaxID=2972948 RepID=UPI0021AC645C|nr:ASKHA domain-containing protein [Moorella sulfitireducens]